MRHSWEVTAKGFDRFAEIRSAIAPGTQVNVAFLTGETDADRQDMVARLRDWGFDAVPILAARRLRSADHAVQTICKARRVLVVGGDPAQAVGPYSTGLELIRSGLLTQAGVEEVGLPGHPLRHPQVAEPALWAALVAKVDALRAAGLGCEITTQLCFDPQAVVGWLARLRHLGVDAPVRIGLPTPAAPARLHRFALACGLLPEDADPSRHGWQSGQPEPFLATLAAPLRQDGAVGLHLYPFGGPAQAAAWAKDNPAPFQPCGALHV